ncbi:MAG: hypothetical protein ACTSQZ_00970 [Candidatus Thorarchaeota archaeon]
MEIPFISSFIEGLKLFFASKKLRWLTLVFIIGAIVITVWENVTAGIPALALIALFSGGVFPVFFMITAFLSLLGLQRFVADEESYARSFVLWLIWMVVSLVVLIIMWTVFFLMSVIIFLGVAFLGWIGFQSYFSTRNAVNYAQGVDIDHRSKLSTLLFWGANIFNYVIIIGAFIGTIIFVNLSVIGTAAFGWAFIGMLLALAFNFLNGMIVTWERNKSYAENIVLLGTFISLYSAYFIYNVLKGFTVADPIGIAISIFFILYTMSSVGKSLASRAEKDTRFKISKELAATFTFFLASGFMFVDAMFTTIITHPLIGPTIDQSMAGAAGDAVKLIVFPFVALLMEIRFIWKAKRGTAKPPTPDDIPVIPVEEESVEEVEEPVIVDTPEPVDTTPTYEEPVDEEPSDFSEEPVEEEESSDFE